MSEEQSDAKASRNVRTVVCPCCGKKFEGDLKEGCAACGARAVGPPLARPERELPAYGHALLSIAIGLALLLTFIFYASDALLRRESVAFDFGTLASASEQAAWRLKWTLVPVSFLFVWVCARLRRRMRREPARFVGHAHARAGFVLSAFVALFVSSLVVVNVPEQLRRRELARRAADEAVLYATDRVLYAYRARFGTYPAAASDLRRLPDKDGSVARVIALLESGTYAPEAEVAALSTARDSKGRRRRARIRAASTRDDSAGAGLSLTSYEIVLPGRDKLLGTADDLRIGDGRLLAKGESVKRPTPTPL